MLSRLMTLREQMILAGFAAAIIIGVVTVYLLNKPGTAETLAGTSEAPKASAAVAPEVSQVEAARAKAKAARDTPAPEAPPAPGAAPAELLTAPQPEAAAEVPPATVPAVEPGSPEQTEIAPRTAVREVTVAIEGPVRAPGIYTLPGDRRVRDLIAEAGGAAEGADLSDINLLAVLIDGTTLTVPWQTVVQRGDNSISVRRPPNTAVYNPPQYTRSGTRQLSAQRATAGYVSSVAASAGMPGSGASPAGAKSTGNGLINLNTASADELATLPGIGPGLAERIIAHRTQQPFTAVEDLTNVNGIGEKRLEAVRQLVTVQ
ncbi:MAG: helix-hairpin-helix domain-containing protein [Candidatus Hydrogenedentes bacterium]|nr:helix-hairpin-helix domain-containing protein [Candidatus Hydrogenedentota bacterium]